MIKKAIFDLVSKLSDITAGKFKINDNSDDMHDKIIHFLLAFILFFLVIGGAKADSNYTEDTIHINKLYSECKALIYIDPLAASIKIDSMIIIAKEINNNEDLYKAYNMMGIKYYMFNDHQKAIGAYFQALQYADTDQGKRI